MSILVMLPSGAAAKISRRKTNRLSPSTRQIPILLSVDGRAAASGSIVVTVDHDTLSPALADCVDKAAPEDQAALLETLANVVFLALMEERPEGAAS